MNTNETRLYFNKEHDKFDEFSELLNKGVDKELLLSNRCDDGIIRLDLSASVGRTQEVMSVELENPFIDNTMEEGYVFLSNYVKEHDKLRTPTIPHYLRLNTDGSITLVSVVQFPPTGVNPKETESCTFFE